MKRLMITLLLAAALLLPLSLMSAPSASAWTNDDVSVGYAPPPLMWAAQPLCPGDGFYWVPGYWGWSPYGYYWVPGAWVWPPFVGLFWTPGYWGWYDGDYWWHRGYWGHHVGFYGGIDYGHGYPGRGYEGGYWHHHHFFYNRAVLHVNARTIHFTYRKSVTVPHRRRRISYNGGRGGIALRPSILERTWANERHLGLTAMQRKQRERAQHDPAMRFANNHGRPVFDGHRMSSGATLRPQPVLRRPETPVRHRLARLPRRPGFVPHGPFRPEPMRLVGRSSPHNRPRQPMREPLPILRGPVYRSHASSPVYRFRPRREPSIRAPSSEYRPPFPHAERSYRRLAPRRPPP